MKGPAKPGGRLRSAYSQMLVCCPEKIAAYGSCIRSNISDISQGKCEREYQQLHKCFLSALRKKKAPIVKLVNNGLTQDFVRKTMLSTMENFKERLEAASRALGDGPSAAELAMITFMVSKLLRG